jgi:hypothetical protein
MIRMLAVLLPVALLLAGCFSQSRSETTKTDRITFQAQVPVPTAEGVKIVPVSGTIRRIGTEQEETHAGPDTEAITQAVAQGLAATGALATGGGFPWSNVLGGIGAALTAGTTGYLALKKREQMRGPSPGAKREAT